MKQTPETARERMIRYSDDDAWAYIQGTRNAHRRKYSYLRQVVKERIKWGRSEKIWGVIKVY